MERTKINLNESATTVISVSIVQDETPIWGLRRELVIEFAFVLALATLVTLTFREQ